MCRTSLKILAGNHRLLKAVIVLGLVASAVCCFFVMARTSPASIEWHIPPNPDVNSILWPKDNHKKLWSPVNGSKPQKIVVNVPDHKSIAMDVSLLNVWAHDDRSLELITASSVNLDMPGALKLAEDLTQSTRSSFNRIEEWSKHYRTESNPPLEVIAKSAGVPSISIEAGPSFDAQKPFVIHVSVFWN